MTDILATLIDKMRTKWHVNNCVSRVAALFGLFSTCFNKLIKTIKIGYNFYNGGCRFFQHHPSLNTKRQSVWQVLMMEDCLRKARHCRDITACVFVGRLQRGLEVKTCQVAWTTNIKHPLIMCRRKKQNWDGGGTVALFCKQSLFTSGFLLFCRAPTWRSCRHQRAKLPSSWLERASKWKHSANADFSALLQHRGICWISSRLAISFYLTRKSQRAVRAAVGPRRRGPAGLEWSWERTAKLLLPPSALRRARGSCHRPCGWGSEHKTHQATR